MANVKFWRGTRTAFDAKQKDESTLYFLTDENIIYKGASLQGTTVVPVDTDPVTPVQGVVYVNTTNGEVKYRSGSTWVTMMHPVVTEITAAATDTQVPTAKAVYTAVNNVATQLGGTIREPVQDVDALKAIGEADLSDKLLCFVEDAGSLYRYDAQAEDEESTVEGKANIVKPTGVTGAGRWFRMFTALNLTGDNVVQVNGQAISVKLDATYFEADSTKGLTLKGVAGTTENNLAAFTADGHLKDSTYSVTNTVTEAASATKVVTQAAVLAYGKTIAASAEINWLED